MALFPSTRWLPTPTVRIQPRVVNLTGPELRNVNIFIDQNQRVRTGSVEFGREGQWNLRIPIHYLFTLLGFKLGTFRIQGPTKKNCEQFKGPNPMNPIRLRAETKYPFPLTVRTSWFLSAPLCFKPRGVNLKDPFTPLGSCSHLLVLNSDLSRSWLWALNLFTLFGFACTSSAIDFGTLVHSFLNFDLHLFRHPV